MSEREGVPFSVGQRARAALQQRRGVQPRELRDLPAPAPVRHAHGRQRLPRRLLAVLDARHRPQVIASDCLGVLDQLASYSRELDDDGEPTEDIDNDAAYHYLAALRYACSWICRGGLRDYGPASPPGPSAVESLPPGVFGNDRRDEAGQQIPDPRGTVSSGSWEGGGMNFPQF